MHIIHMNIEYGHICIAPAGLEMECTTARSYRTVPYFCLCILYDTYLSIVWRAILGMRHIVNIEGVCEWLILQFAGWRIWTQFLRAISTVKIRNGGLNANSKTSGRDENKIEDTPAPYTNSVCIPARNHD